MKKEKHYNSFQNKKTSNSRNMFGSTTCKIDFGESLKSVNIENYMFTNYFANKKLFYKFVKNNIKGIVNNRISLVDSSLFETKLVNVDNDLFLKLKIESILNLTSENRVRVIPTLYKFKELNNKELQYYVEKIDVDNFIVRFIDLYHLVIPAPDYERGEKEEHSKEKYEFHKNDSINLSEIKKELNL